MSDEVYIVSAYTPDTEREDILRNLVNQLHQANKDILLISHSVTPTDIIKKCRYHVYDSENRILQDDQYKLYAWNTVVPGITVRSKDVKRTYSTLIPVYKLVLYGFGFAKMVGYKYAHYVEYDCKIEDFKFFDIHVKILETHGCSAYTNIHGHPIGFYFAFNLDYYTFDDLKFDEKKFLDKFTEHSPNLYLVEELTRHFFMDPKHPHYQDESYIREHGMKGGLYCSKNSKTGINSWVIPLVLGDTLHMFITEFDNAEITVEYVINDFYRRIKMKPGEYYYFPLCSWKDAKYLKIMVNGDNHLEYDLTNEETRNRLIRNNFVE